MAIGVNVAGVDLVGLADQLNAAYDDCILSANDTVALANASVVKAIEFGRQLFEAKNKVGHGNWTKWVEANCVFSPDRAGRYIKAYKERDEIRRSATDLTNLTSLRSIERLLAKPKATTTSNNPKPTEESSTSEGEGDHIEDKITPAAEEIIRGTDLEDSEEDLRKIAALPPEQQQLVAMSVKEGEPVSVDDAIETYAKNPSPPESGRSSANDSSESAGAADSPSHGPRVTECIAWMEGEKAKAGEYPTTKDAVENGGFCAGVVAGARKVLGLSVIRGKQKASADAAAAVEVPAGPKEAADLLMPDPKDQFDTYSEWMKIESAMTKVFRSWPENHRTEFIGGLNTLAMRLSGMRV